MKKRQEAETPLTDLAMTMAMGFLTLLIVLLAFIGSLKKDTDERKKVGTLSARLTWADKVDGKCWDQDLDLWVMKPDGEKVGYSSKVKGGAALDYDDLGLPNDTTCTNMEFWADRSATDGRYVFTVHWYSKQSQAAPAEGRVIVVFQPVKKNVREVVCDRTVKLRYKKDEQMVCAVTLKDGQAFDVDTTSDFTVHGRY